jgi:acetyl esterase/lipase
MGGDKDFNVTLVGGEQMYQALKSVGVPAEVIVCPGQFHGFTRPSFIRNRYERSFAWYDKYLGMKPLPRSSDNTTRVAIGGPVIARKLIHSPSILLYHSRRSPNTI